MNMRIDKDIFRPEDLDLIVDGDLYEFVNGAAVEKHMGAESGQVSATLMIRLGGFVQQNGLGGMYDAQTGFQCFPAAPSQVRKPDVAFVAADRLPGGRPPKGNFKIAPDLAAEVVSPNDTYEEVEEKMNDYRAAGIRLVWVISPESRTVLVRRPDGACTALTDADDLSGEDVIPGFTCKVADLFV